MIQQNNPGFSLPRKRPSGRAAGLSKTPGFFSCITVAAIIVDVGDNDPGRAIVVARGDKAVDDILKLAALDRQLPVFLQ